MMAITRRHVGSKEERSERRPNRQKWLCRWLCEPTFHKNHDPIKEKARASVGAGEGT